MRPRQTAPPTHLPCLAWLLNALAGVNGPRGYQCMSMHLKDCARFKLCIEEKSKNAVQQTKATCGAPASLRVQLLHALCLHARSAIRTFSVALKKTKKQCKQWKIALVKTAHARVPHSFARAWSPPACPAVEPTPPAGAVLPWPAARRNLAMNFSTGGAASDRNMTCVPCRGAARQVSTHG